MQSNISPDSTQTTVTGLDFGTSYIFKLQSLNGFGLSDFSAEIRILCAFVPEAPQEPSTTVIADKVLVEWQQPSD